MSISTSCFSPGRVPISRLDTATSERLELWITAGGGVPRTIPKISKLFRLNPLAVRTAPTPGQRRCPGVFCGSTNVPRVESGYGNLDRPGSLPAQKSFKKSSSPLSICCRANRVGGVGVPPSGAGAPQTTERFTVTECTPPSADDDGCGWVDAKILCNF